MPTPPSPLMDNSSFIIYNIVQSCATSEHTLHTHDYPTNDDDAKTFI